MKKIIGIMLAAAMLTSMGACSLNAEAKTINALDRGVVAKEGVDNTKAMKKLFDSLSDGDTVTFPEGVYEFGSVINLAGKKNITVLGENAVFVRTGVENTSAASEGRTGAIFIEGCDGVTIKGITLKYSGVTSVSGEIKSKNASLGTVDIKVYDDFPVTGEEFFMCLNAFDKNGIPDKSLEIYKDTGFNVVLSSEQTLTLIGLSDDEFSRAKVGEKVCLRAAAYNNYLVTVVNSSNLVFEDMNIVNAYNGAFLIEPRSFNATFRRVKVKSDIESALMSTNCDALHIAGLGGSLTVDECEFYSVGDDCLNVHTMAGVVKEISGNSAQVVYGRTGEKFDGRWASSGDEIEFFDHKTFKSLGTAVVTGAWNGKYTFDAIPEGVTEKTVLSNKTLHPSVTVTNTIVNSNRARAFLLQTDDVLIENCNIYGTSLAGVLISPDIAYWYEVAPGRNITIRNNTFENCGESSYGVILLNASHDGGTDTYPAEVNQNVTVEGNTFKNCKTSAVFAASTTGLTVKDNLFENIHGTWGERKYAVYTVNSDTVTVSGNKLVGTTSDLFGSRKTENCTVDK